MGWGEGLEIQFNIRREPTFGVETGVERCRTWTVIERGPISVVIRHLPWTVILRDQEFEWTVSKRRLLFAVYWQLAVGL